MSTELPPPEVLPAKEPSEVPGDFALELRRQSLSAWEASESALATALSQKLTIAFLGSASSGKDSAIRALFGFDFGDISPIPGSTDRLKAIPLDAEGNVLVVNAPGFGDIRPEVDSVARKLLDSLDIVIYVVNCEGGATIDEKRDLEAIRALGRPVLVCLNKVDLIRPAQREHFVEATVAQLGVPRTMAIVCAFDPLPQLAPEPIGVSYVVDWISKQLQESGKELVFAKHLRNKAVACEPLIQRAAQAAAMAGAIPIPGADLAAVTAIQVKMIRDIATVFEVPVDRDVAMFIMSQVLSGGMRGFVRWGTEALKAAGWIPGTQIAEAAILAVGAAVAGATTFGVGKAAVGWFQNGGKMEADGLRVLFDAAAWDYQRKLRNP